MTETKRGRPRKPACYCGDCRECRLEMRAAETPRKTKPAPPPTLSPLTLAILNEPPSTTPPKPDTNPWDPPPEKHRTNRNTPNSEKTHCDNGHEFTEDNTRMQRSGSGHLFRACITCARARGRERYRRLKEQKATA